MVDNVEYPGVTNSSFTLLNVHIIKIILKVNRKFRVFTRNLHINCCNNRKYACTVVLLNSKLNLNIYNINEIETVHTSAGWVLVHHSKVHKSAGWVLVHHSKVHKSAGGSWYTTVRYTSQPVGPGTPQ